MSERILSLRCRACGATTPIAPAHACDECFGPLEVAYDYAEIGRRVSRASIDAGPASIWRYRDLLPLEDDLEPITLGEGWSPLIRAENLGELLGLRNLYLKNDTQNPTNSFKDRVVSVAASWARGHGFGTIACASTGNLANAVAAYAAHAAMRAVIIIPADLEAAKISTTAVFRPTLVRVNGTYDDANRLGSELVDEVPWAFCNINVRPFYSEGSKTLTYETVEQLGWRLPDEIIIPIASGSQFVKAQKAIHELVDLGLVAGPAHTRLTGAQASGCAPVADAFATGRPVVPVRHPDTVARSLAIGSPSDGEDVIRASRQTGGVVESVSDEEILDSVELLARTEGVFAETAGGVTVAVLRRLAAAGRWKGDETVVAYITGHGLKTAEFAGGPPPARRADRPVAARLRGALPRRDGGGARRRQGEGAGWLRFREGTPGPRSRRPAGCPRASRATSTWAPGSPASWASRSTRRRRPGSSHTSRWEPSTSSRTAWFTAASTPPSPRPWHRSAGWWPRPPTAPDGEWWGSRTTPASFARLGSASGSTPRRCPGTRAAASTSGR